MKPGPDIVVRDDGISIRGAAVDQMIVRMRSAGEGFRTPLLRAARDRILNVLLAHDGQPVSARILKFRMPTLIVIGDDHPAAIGPAGWRQAARLLRWTNHLTLHAAGGREEHYSAAVLATVAHGRAMLIEVEYAHHAEWLALAQRVKPRLPILSIVPRPGAVHPMDRVPAGAMVQ